MIMTRRTLLIVWATAALILTMAPRLYAQQPLHTARELYAQAEYQDALNVLNTLSVMDYSREDRQAIDLYKTLCLFAVGRRAEADRALEAMVAQDPLYRPSADDLPPRMRAALTEARKRMLPSIIQQKYAEAKGAFDRKDYGVAEGGFRQVLDALADPDVSSAAAQSPLADLKTLADGFYALSVKANAPAPTLAAEPPPPPAPVMPQAPRTYSANDPGITAPVIIRQKVPAYRGKVVEAANGIIEVVIDTTGAVESAKMRVPLNAQYDKLVLAAAKGWQYQPATLQGAPVKFRKMVQITLVPNPSVPN
jgi:tetratricopeptide (TPR) repeat protein